MKATKNLGKALLLTTAIVFNSQVRAGEEVTLPTITAPAVFLEGTQRELTTSQIAELLPWAKNSKMFLTDALQSIEGLSTIDKVDRLVTAIETSVQDSGPKKSELFMRFILNRALEINKILNKEMDEASVGAADVKLRVLIQSVSMAVKYYDVDLKVMSQKSPSPFKDFGVEYFNFLNDLNKSIFDASAQYTIQKLALELLQWDLYRDLDNKTYAPQILKINNNLKFYPAKKVSDTDALKYIKQMKKMSAELDFKSVVKVNELPKFGMIITKENSQLLYASCRTATYIEAGTAVEILGPNTLSKANLDGRSVEIIQIIVKNQPYSTSFSSQAPIGCVGYINTASLQK